MRRFQNNMGASRIALPVMVLYSVCLWGVMLLTDNTLWVQCLIFIVNIYLLVELNNRNAIMRIYSRMVSCSYMVFMLMSPWLLKNLDAMVVQMCFLLTLTFLFQTYQEHGSNGKKYGAYLFFGIAVMIWPPLFFALPLLWIADAFFLMSFSFKSWLASLLGLITPLWCLMPYVVLYNKYDALYMRLKTFIPDDKTLQAFSDITTILPKEMPLTGVELCSMALVVLMAVTGMIHFLRHSADDKIHVRMLFNVFNLMFLTSTAALTLLYILPLSDMPGTDIMCGVMVVCAAPLIAHYINFTSTRITNISVILAMIMVLVLTAISHLQEWLTL